MIYTASHRYLFPTVPAPTAIYTLSLHDALPISAVLADEIGEVRRPHLQVRIGRRQHADRKLLRQLQGSRVLTAGGRRSEEHTSELQSLTNLVCRLLLEKKKTMK